MKNESFLSRFCDQPWLYFVYALGLVMLYLVIYFWNVWELPQLLMGIYTVVLALHIFEEDQFPSGFPFMNNAGFGSPEPKVYPQNRLTNMVTNLGATIVLFVLTFFVNRFAQAALTFIVIFSVGQAGMHTKLGINMYQRYKDKGKKTIYGPGLVNTYLCMIPTAVVAFHWLLQHPYRWLDLLYGFLMVFAIAFTLIGIPFIISKKVKSQTYALRDMGYFAKYEEK